MGRGIALSVALEELVAILELIFRIVIYPLVDLVSSCYNK